MNTPGGDTSTVIPARALRRVSGSSALHGKLYDRCEHRAVMPSCAAPTGGGPGPLVSGVCPGPH